ncbi:pre-B lymphocyte protein 3 [Hyla sarda]|uniref:pre-B lymphocyte protein 3 n=1 Tax=Hyla sarda TaxID=327740 RepID=UPI0024C391C5|nr:pre-B lymphocyte protein 3 [Hyla sarda]
MSWAALFYTLVFFCKYCATQVTVTQSASTSVSTGDTVIISCTVQGFSISDRYVYWYQQKEGDKPRYLLWYDSDSRKHQGTGVPDRFSGSKDSSQNTGYLTIKQCTLDDEAYYYCAMWHPSITWLHTVTKQ